MDRHETSTANTQRIVSLDVFRGLMLLSMTFNHLIVFPFISLGALNDFVINYVYNKMGYLSNSEGFFFLSGIASAMAYSKLLYQDGLWKKIKRRIGQMYCIHIALLFLFSLAIVLSRSYWEQWKILHQMMEYWKSAPGIHFYLDNPCKGLLLGASFLYFLPLFDMLPIYMLFLLSTPFLLKQFDKGRAFATLTTSALLWLGTQYWPPGLLEQSIGSAVKLNWFHPGAVQILFVSGLAVGFFYKKGTLWPIKKIFFAAALFLMASYFILLVSKVAFRKASIYDVQLDVPRLVFFFFKATVAAFVSRWICCRPLEALGKNSLSVFSYHIVLTYALMYFLVDITALAYPQRLLLLGASLLSPWLLVIPYKNIIQKLFHQPKALGLGKME